MDGPVYRQAWGCPASLSDQHSQPVARPAPSPGVSSFAPMDWSDVEENYVGRSPVPAITSNLAILPLNPQPYSIPDPQFSLIHCWRAGDPASSSFGRSPCADLPLSATDPRCRTPVKDHGFQQNLLLWPQPTSTSGHGSIPLTYADPSHELSSGFGPTPTSGGSQIAQRPKATSSRCINCWTRKKRVISFIR